jgi:cation diffusion facilitator CzcD-associated flavoprotein CzcO
VIGGGLGGLMTAAKLRELGIENIRVIEQGGDFGGTWYWNRYPGIRCDIEAYIYVPLLEEVGTIPTEKYAEGKEILAHCQAAGRKYGLYERALFQTRVTRLAWDELDARWVIETHRGDAIRARYVIIGNGPLQRPKLPGIPGIKNFTGRVFHTSRWDYEFTGGTSSGKLDRLGDKKIAVIGTGATGIQVIPQVAEAAQHLYVFQRTPSAVDVRGNKPTDVEWYKRQKPGWQQRRKDNFLSIMVGVPHDEDMVDDCWTEVWGKLANWGGGGEDETPEQQAARIQMLDFERMEQIRARISNIVKDPKTAESLKPWYNLFCKRPLYSDEYLQTFNRDNVTLVDTEGRGVEKIDETGLWANGQHYDVDAIVFATGFQFGIPPHESGGYELIGRDGLTLVEKWGDGVRSIFGIQTRGFPNLFIVGTLSQASVAVNYPHVASEQAKHSAELVAECLKDGIRTFEVKQQAEDRWGQVVKEKANDTSVQDAECTPGYFNHEGDTSKPSFFGALYGGGPFEYFQLCEQWRRGECRDEVEITKL